MVATQVASTRIEGRSTLLSFMRKHNESFTVGVASIVEIVSAELCSGADVRRGIADLRCFKTENQFARHLKTKVIFRHAYQNKHHPNR